MANMPQPIQPHSSAWIAQTWISFVVAVGITAMGIWFLPVDIWVKAFMGMGLLFSVGSTFSLAKTVRDQHEAMSIKQRIDDARVSRLIAEHDPLKPAL
ncbi:MAG: YiaA/YiaB family inner membrane protein [Myxococcaceae bacterium]